WNGEQRAALRRSDAIPSDPRRSLCPKSEEPSRVPLSTCATALTPAMPPPGLDGVPAVRLADVIASDIAPARSLMSVRPSHGPTHTGMTRGRVGHSDIPIEKKCPSE